MKSVESEESEEDKNNNDGLKHPHIVHPKKLFMQDPSQSMSMQEGALLRDISS